MANTEPTMRLFGQLFGKEDRAEAFIAITAGCSRFRPMRADWSMRLRSPRWAASTTRMWRS